jgi:hypothetical protein
MHILAAGLSGDIFCTDLIRFLSTILHQEVQFLVLHKGVVWHTLLGGNPRVNQSQDSTNGTAT